MKPTRQLLVLIIVLLVALLLATNVALSSGVPASLAQVTGTPPANSLWARIFLPLLRRSEGAYTISGRVIDQSANPVPGVHVVDQAGRSAVTGADGSYALQGLTAGDYDLAPAKDGLAFSPAMANVDLPGGGSQVDFTAISACTEKVANGGFENNTAWDFPLTPFPAGYTTELFHSGARSARTGILRTAENTLSYSSVRSPVIAVPAGIGSATLRVWLLPQSEEGTAVTLLDAPQGPEFGEAVFSHDAQYVLVLDPGATLAQDELLETLLWMRSDSQTWGLYEFDLTRYAGQEIKLQFGTFNDGAGGVSAMFVDDVSLQVCDAPAVTPTPTPTGVPATCQNRLDNTGFELNGSWDIPLTVFPAAYTTERAHSGARSMRTGIVRTTDNVFSYSDAGQWVTIPSDTAVATLSLWALAKTEGESLLAAQPLPARPQTGLSLADFHQQALADDAQYVLILNRFSQIAEVLLWQRVDAAGWTLHEFDLTKYKGQTIKVQFGTFNNGVNGVTSLYVDDATVVTCTTTAPTPTPTVTPTPTATPIFTPTPTNTPPPGVTPTPTATPLACSDRILNGGFELTSDWVIPITAFSAGYDAERAHSGNRSMRTGILHTAHNRFSYSDFRQTVTIPADAESAVVRFWQFPLSEDAALLQVPAEPLSRVFGTESPGGDVQYLLVLDRFGNWIDTLLWQRSDAAQWIQVSTNLNRYIGATIKLQFGTFNDGLGGVSSMHIDDVSVQVCE